jgi:hypothetical protein
MSWAGALVLALALLGAASAQAKWSVALTQKGSYESGISCWRASGCLITGGRYTTMQTDLVPYRAGTIAARAWNGHRWSRGRLPLPTGVKYANMGPISCVARGMHKPFCMAVGSYWTKRRGHPDQSLNHPFAEKLASGHWTAHPLTRRGSVTFARTWAVSCVSSRFCMAAADQTAPGEPGIPLIERYNGHRWLRISPTMFGDVALTISDLSCASVKFCMLVGGVAHAPLDPGVYQPATATWNGYKWAAATSPAAGVSALSCPVNSGCMGVETVQYDAAAQTWENNLWATPSLLPGGAPDGYVGKPSCTSLRFCMAFVTSHFLPAPVPVEWNGSTWTEQLGGISPHIAHAYPGQVSCSSSHACMALVYPPSGSIVLRYHS